MVTRGQGLVGWTGRDQSGSDRVCVHYAAFFFLSIAARTLLIQYSKNTAAFHGGQVPIEPSESILDG